MNTQLLKRTAVAFLLPVLYPVVHLQQIPLLQLLQRQASN